MATFTSVQSGNASSGSTFNQNMTIGDDSGDDVLACYGPASGADSGGFVIPVGVTLTLKGAMRSGGDGSYITVAGSIVIATNYNGYISPGNNNINEYSVV